MSYTSFILLLLLAACAVFGSAQSAENYGDGEEEAFGSATSEGEEAIFTLQVPQLDDTSLDNLLSFRYYRKSCPQFESILNKKVKEWIRKDYTLGASLMRLHFHDCSLRVRNLLSPFLDRLSKEVN